MSDKELLETIKSNQLAILQHQETLKRMYDTVDLKFTEIIKKLDKFKKEFRVRKSLQNCLISIQGLGTHQRQPENLVEPISRNRVQMRFASHWISLGRQSEKRSKKNYN